MTDSICMSCGERLHADDAFCGGCGRPTGGSLPADNRMPAGYNTPAGYSTPAGYGTSAAQAPPAAVPGQLPAVGMGAANAQYLGRRLEYDRLAEETFESIAANRLLRAFAIRALLFVLILFVGWAVWLAITVVLAVSNVNNSNNASLRDVSGVIETMWLIGVLATLVVIVLWLVLPASVPLSEWKFLVDDGAPAAMAALAAIAWSLRRRHPPAVVGIRRLKNRDAGIRDYLEIRQGHFTGMIACFGYGTDLFVSWTLWLSMSPIGFAWQIVRSIPSWRMVLGGSHSALAMDGAAALREVIHNATREGVDTASGPPAAAQEQVLAALPVSVSDIDF